MRYQVLRKLRWGLRNYRRGDTLIPKNHDEEYRCRILVDTGFLAPLVSDQLLKNLQSAGVQVNPRVRPISKASEVYNNVKQPKGEKDNG